MGWKLSSGTYFLISAGRYYGKSLSTFGETADSSMSILAVGVQDGRGIRSLSVTEMVDKATEVPSFREDKEILDDYYDEENKKYEKELQSFLQLMSQNQNNDANLQRSAGRDGSSSNGGISNNGGGSKGGRGGGYEVTKGGRKIGRGSDGVSYNIPESATYNPGFL